MFGRQTLHTGVSTGNRFFADIWAMLMLTITLGSWPSFSEANNNQACSINSQPPPTLTSLAFKWKRRIEERSSSDDTITMSSILYISLSRTWNKPIKAFTVKIWEKKNQLSWGANHLVLNTLQVSYRIWSLLRKTWKTLEKNSRAIGHNNLHMKQIWKKCPCRWECVHKTSKEKTCFECKALLRCITS